MADNQTGGPQLPRFDFHELCEDYKPTVDELIHSEYEVLTMVFSNMREEYLVCLIGETLSQLWCAEKQNELLDSAVTQIDVEDIQRRIETTMTQDGIVSFMLLSLSLQTLFHRV